jgi:hypothetical protein
MSPWRETHAWDLELFVSKTCRKNLYHYQDLSEEIEDPEELIKILCSTYSAIGDISYNECSIFFWDCMQIEEATPMGKLTNTMLKDLDSYYDLVKDAFFQSPNNFLDFLTNDLATIEKLTEKNVAYEVRRIQVDLVKDLLGLMITSAFYDFGKGKAAKKSIMNEETAYVIQVHSILGTLDGINIKEDIKEKLRYDSVFRPKFFNWLYSKYGPLTSQFSFIIEGQEFVQYQIREFEEFQKERFDRGFYTITEGLEPFFVLNKNPTQYEIKKILEKEVVPVEDNIIDENQNTSNWVNKIIDNASIYI